MCHAQNRDPEAQNLLEKVSANNSVSTFTASSDDGKLAE